MAHGKHGRQEGAGSWSGYEVSFVVGDEVQGDEIKDVRQCRLILGTDDQCNNVILTLDMKNTTSIWIDDEQLPKQGPIYYRFVCDVIFAKQPNGHAVPHPHPDVETVLTEIKKLR